jgi:hypothetical protein
VVAGGQRALTPALQYAQAQIKKNFFQLTHSGHMAKLSSLHSPTLSKGHPMIWKLLGLEKILDGLFDEGWCKLGLPESSAAGDALFAE